MRQGVTGGRHIDLEGMGVVAMRAAYLRPDAVSARSTTTSTSKVRPRATPMLAGILYRHETEWLPMPAWAHFFVELGVRIARYQSDAGPLVVALSLPLRAFAAALSGAGVVLSRAQSVADSTAASDHFQLLCDLATNEPDTPVYYVQNVDGRLKRTAGRLQGVVHQNGTSMVKVLIGTERQGATTSLINRQLAFKVQLARKAGSIGRSRMLRRQDFLASALGSADLNDHLFHTQLDCVILGTVGLLAQEIVETPLAFADSTGMLSQGTLQDILRVCRFFADSQHYRSEIFPAIHEGRPLARSELGPGAVIFDGAAGFLRWRDDWRGTPWLVLLDRTEPHFAEALEAVKSEDMGRVSDAKGLHIPAIPPGVEITTFEVAR